MRKKYIPFLCFYFLFGNLNSAQAQVTIVGFYNCENYYDTVNQAQVMDEEYLPSSDKHYSQSVYQLKTKRLASVIYALGEINQADGLAMMGMVEIENKMVLTQLVNQPLIKKYHYQFIHFDSKDARGVDVALLYHPAKFIPYQYKIYGLTDEKHFTTYATRDILYVKGKLANQKVHVLVNHWPSRRGGERQSAGNRLWASQICKKIMDSVKSTDPFAKFIVMGDFNDNPSDKSLLQLQMTNPFLKMYQNGLGSMAYQDSWHLFDQILLSPNWSAKEGEKGGDGDLSNYKSIIYKNSAMIEMDGKYRGYPKRTYNGNQFRGGYSDHFPVALIFSLKLAENPQ
jgi:hypothetical protein